MLATMKSSTFFTKQHRVAQLMFHSTDHCGIVL